MKRVYLCAAVLAVRMGTAAAESDRSVSDVVRDLAMSLDYSWERRGDQWWFDHPPRGARPCAELIVELDKLGAPGSTTIKLQTKDTPDWQGGVLTLDAVRPICAKWTRKAAIDGWWTSLNLAIQESQKIGTDAYYDTALFNLCLHDYQRMLEGGIKPTDPIPEWDVTLANGTTFTLTGTVEEVRKKYCDVGMAKVRAEMEAKFAPYRKALKNDKLSMVVIEGANSARAYILPGGKVSTDPKRLAAAAVWFSDTTTSDRVACRGKDQHVVHRYQFDKNHKLVKTTDKSYCGKVPARAFK